MQIWRMRADGTEQEQVTTDEFNNWFPHPSPDGRALVFLSYEKDVTGHPENKDVTLRRMTLDGQEDRRARPVLRRPGDDQRPVLVARRPEDRVRDLPGDPLILNEIRGSPTHLDEGNLPMLHSLAPPGRRTRQSGCPEERRPPEGALLRQPDGVRQRRHPPPPARGPLGRRTTFRRAEQRGVRRHDHPGRRRGDPREARPLPGRRLLHGDQSPGRGQGRAHRVGPRRRGVRRHPFHGQHLPEPPRVRRDARRVVRPASLADQGGPADEGPGEGRGPDAPGDAAPGGVVRDRRRHLPVQELRPRARCSCC